MKIGAEYILSGPGLGILAAAVLAAGFLAFRSAHRSPTPLPVARSAPTVNLPKILTREIAAFTRPPATVPSAAPKAVALSMPKPASPLTLVTSGPDVRTPSSPLLPYGRLVPCETVNALESNRLETPIIGLVTADVWHDGKCIIPAGTEVHGRALLDRARERLGAQSAWRFVWRSPDADNGKVLPVEGLLLDREFDGTKCQWGDSDGSGGLRGQIVKSTDERELRLFAATFLSAATTALQEVRPAAGFLSEATIPTATARNAALAGTGAVLRDYAQSLREAIERDGFFLRVPAGKPFYLYLTQTLERSPGGRMPAAPLSP